MELISRSESGLEPEPRWEGGSGSGLGYGTTSASALGSRDRLVSGPSSKIPDAPPSTPPRGQVQAEDGYLGVPPKWGEKENDPNSRNNRASRMIGRSPPPPPGPPPSDPPPLPPASSHPFASSSSVPRPRPSARLSSLSSLRKAHMIPSRPASPAGPPPSGDLPPLPSTSSASTTFHESNSTGSRPGHSRKFSDAPPQMSPRSSSLLTPQQLQAGPSGTSSTAGALGTPISLDNSMPHGQAADQTQIQPESSTSQSAPSTSAPSQPASSSRTSSKPPRTPSRHLLQTALDLAQRAVEMDRNNDVLGALAAYREAVSRLKSVMERVGVEPSGERRRKTGSGKSEEEGRTLRGIHDAYVARIQLLSSYETNPEPTGHTVPKPSSSTPPSSNPNPTQSTATLVPPAPSQTTDEGTPRPSLDDGGLTGIGNFMLADTGDQSSDISALNSPAKQAPAPGLAPSRGRSDTQPPVPSQVGVDRASSPPSISQRLGQTGTSSPKLPTINGAVDNDLSLQQALDRAADASTQGPVIGPGRGSFSTANINIGLGYPTSPPSMVQASVTALTSTPTKGPPGPRAISEDDIESPSPSRSRFKRPARPSLGLDMETDLTGVDGVDEDMEVLARTPRESSMPSTSTSTLDSRERRSSGGPGKGSTVVQSSPGSMRSEERPLPPLPDSAPALDAAGQPVVAARTASLNGGSVPLRPASGVFLVSPTTSQGAISQRRQSRPISGNMSAALEQLKLAPQPQPQAQVAAQTSAGSGGQAFPVSSSSSSIRSTSASSIGTRVRAKSQPGHRPLVHSSSELPPIPPSQIRHKASFSSSSHLGTGLIPQIQRPQAGSQASLKINLDYQNQNQNHSLNLSHGGLAPPANITSNPRSGSPRSLPPLPDTAISSTSIMSGAGSLISPLPEAQPMEAVHRPFHLLRIIHASMDPESSGSYLTGAIHISSAVWNPSNWSSNANLAGTAGGGGSGKMIAPPKIVGQDTKVRCIEALVLHFESVRITGQSLLLGPRDRHRTGGKGENGRIAEELCAVLDELDEEMDNTHKLLVKQGVGVGGWKGKKNGGTSKSWGSRISRSMDKMTNSKTDRLDSTDKYVDLLAHLCGGAQVIDDHLLNFTGECTHAYASLSDKAYRNIEARLRRTAEFMGAVVVPFVLDDFKQFFLRYLKGGVRYLED